MPSPVQPAPLTAINAGHGRRPSSSDRTQAPDSFVVHYSTFAFGLFWVIFLVVHAAAIVYYEGSAWVYFHLPSTFFALSLDFFNIWRYQHLSKTIGIIQWFFAALHLACICQAARRFMRWRRHRFTAPIVKTIMQSNRVHDPEWSDKLAQFLDDHHLGCMRHFSIDGKYFERVHLVQEMVEIIMQSIQVYRLSQTVPSQRLIIAMTALLVLNCWSTPLVSRVHTADVPHARFWATLTDCFLDVVVAIVLPILIALPYFALYDPVAQDLPWSVWYDEKWIVRVTQELQFLLIESPWGLINNVFFSVSTLYGLEILKSMLVLNHNSKSGKPRIQRRFPMMTRSHHRIENAMRTSTSLWGIALVFSLLTSQLAPSVSPICTVQVRPWFSSRARCIVLNVDCQRYTHTIGTSSAIPSLLENVEPSTVSAVAFRHCSHLEIPDIIRDFSAVVVFKVYNSTIVRWDSNAALTNRFHPHLLMAYFALVNFTEFPVGLLNPDFPRQLMDVVFAETNMTTLPDSVAEIWPSGMALVLEKSGLTAVPDAMVRLNAACISLCGNELQEVPADLLAQDGADSLWLNANPMALLPMRSLELGKRMKQIRFANTNVSDLPSWIDREYFERGGTIVAGGSPFCASLVGHNTSDGPKSFVREAYSDGLIDCKVLEGDDLFHYPSVLEANLVNELN